MELNTNASLHTGGYRHDFQLSIELFSRQKQLQKIQRLLNPNQAFDEETVEKAYDKVTEEKKEEVFTEYYKLLKVRKIRREAPVEFANLVVAFGAHILRYRVPMKLYKVLCRAMVGKIHAMSIRKRFDNSRTMIARTSTFIATRCEAIPPHQAALALSHPRCCVFCFQSPEFEVAGEEIDPVLKIWDDRQITKSLADYIMLMAARLWVHRAFNGSFFAVKRVDEVYDASIAHQLRLSGLQGSVLCDCPSPSRVFGENGFLDNIRMDEDLFSITEFRENSANLDNLDSVTLIDEQSPVPTPQATTGLTSPTHILH